MKNRNTQTMPLFDEPQEPSLSEGLVLRNEMIECWFDGACEPRNPGGHGSYGVVIANDGMIVLSRGGYVGSGPAMSNNVAEYAGVCALLEALAKMEGNAVVYGDSQLVIRQLSGKMKAKHGLYLPYYEQAKALLAPLKARVRFQWIPREQNTTCDSLSKEVLRGRGIKLHIQRDEIVA